MEKVLEGIRALDFCQFKAGPTCGQTLAQMGAEVIRVEAPEGSFDRQVPPYAPDGQSIYLAYTCHNKKGITLNLKKEKGRELQNELVKKSDIVIEAFGPDTSKKLALNYESLREIKKDIIVVSVSAYGQYGPYANRLGFDAMAQAISGIMWATGFPEQNRPLKLGVSFVDFATGVYGALGAVLALYHRDKTGRGQLIDVSLSDVAMAYTETVMGEYKVANQVRPQLGNASSLIAPYDAYEAKDGWVQIGAITSSQWKSLREVVGNEGLISNPKFEDLHYRLQAEESRQIITEWLGRWISVRTVDEVVNQLNEVDIGCAPVNTIPQAFSDPHIRARDMIVNLDYPGIGKVPVPGIPIKLSETPGEIRSLSPALGEHNEDVYCGLLGLSPEQLSNLKQEGVI